MARNNSADSDSPAADNTEASNRSQQELYGRAEPTDLDEGRIGRDDQTDIEDPEPGRGTDGTGRPSTARANANTTT